LNGSERRRRNNMASEGGQVGKLGEEGRVVYKMPNVGLLSICECYDVMEIL
jgi:hypothetical protein